MRTAKQQKAFQDQTNKRIGARLKQTREWRHMSQADIARALNISRGRWSMYEAGKRALNVYVMIEFCQVVEADPAFILIGKRPKIPRGLQELQRAEEEKADAGG